MSQVSIGKRLVSRTGKVPPLTTFAAGDPMPFIWFSLLMLLSYGCFTPGSQSSAPSFATDLSTGETDGILVEWRHCESKQPCMTGELSQGAAYSLGFAQSPSKVTGQVGGKTVELKLDPQSVYRLGDHALELTYRSTSPDHLLLAVTWNELAQELISHDLVEND